MSFDAQAIADKALRGVELKQELDKAKKLKGQMEPNSAFSEALQHLSANSPAEHRRPVVKIGEITLEFRGAPTVDTEKDEVVVPLQPFYFESAELRRLSSVAFELVEISGHGRRLTVRKAGNGWAMSGTPVGFKESTGRRAGGRIYGHGPERSR